ncbi:PepSY domain-containing protein [Microvirga sp. W0021]|uniref:PepSY domain-containing protein n=1 Tax=Hohaiivirga grylli TaxID=3133970 RepID=A0ABV0BHS6_9HYPH
MSNKIFGRFGVVAGATVAAVLFAAPAMAKDHCTSAPSSEWKPLHEITEHAKQLGYTVMKAERDGSCYEIEGYDKNGAKIEIYYNPQTGLPANNRR